MSSSPTPLPKPIDTGHLLPARRKQSGAGPVIGIIIVLLVFSFGAFYFFDTYLDNKNTVDPLPFIPGDTSAPSA
jgi:hypothetical protein